MGVTDLAVLACPEPERGEQCPDERAVDFGGQSGIEGHAVAQRDGECQHPLAHGNLGEHAVHEVSRGVGHATAAARGAKPSSFARIRYEPVEPAGIAVHAKKAVGRDPASEIVPELTLDEPRHDTASFAGSRQEGFEGTGDRGVKDGARRVPGDVLTEGWWRRRRARLAHIRDEGLIACQ